MDNFLNYSKNFTNKFSIAVCCRSLIFDFPLNFFIIGLRSNSATKSKTNMLRNFIITSIYGEFFPNMENYILSYSTNNQIYNQRYGLSDTSYGELSPEYGELGYLYLLFNNMVISFIRASPLNLSNCLWIK